MSIRIDYSDVASILVGASLLITGIYRLSIGQNTDTTIAMGLLCFLPPVLKMIGFVDIPNPLTIMIIASIGLHTYGLALGFYSTIGWFDTVTHTLSSTTVGILIFYAMMSVQHYSGTKVNFTGVGLSIITGLLAMSFSVYWEVIEYTIDVLTTSITQYSPYDTLTDLMCDAIGVFIASVWVGMYMKRCTIADAVESFKLGKRLRRLASGKTRKDVHEEEGP